MQANSLLGQVSHKQALRQGCLGSRLTKQLHPKKLRKGGEKVGQGAEPGKGMGCSEGVIPLSVVTAGPGGWGEASMVPMQAVHG